jgi:hypothetical protein
MRWLAKPIPSNLSNRCLRPSKPNAVWFAFTITSAPAVLAPNKPGDRPRGCRFIGIISPRKVAPTNTTEAPGERSPSGRPDGSTFDQLCLVVHFTARVLPAGHACNPSHDVPDHLAGIPPDVGDRGLEPSEDGVEVTVDQRNVLRCKDALPGKMLLGGREDECLVNDQCGEWREPE